MRPVLLRLKAAVALVMTIAFTAAQAIAVWAVAPICHKVKVTAYTNHPKCTDSTPNICASGHRIKPADYYHLIALSADLSRQYKFGQKFELCVGGTTYLVEYQDRMHPRWRNKVDFLLPSITQALHFGVKAGTLTPIK